MECRPSCGACCIAPSISSPIPGMPRGKPAGIRCVQLDENNLCMRFGEKDRPAVCRSFSAHYGDCGDNREEAIVHLSSLEALTR